MKTLIAVLIAAASCALHPMPACADMEADLTLSVTGGKLWAYVGLRGIPDCPTSGSVTIEWTSPNDMFESSEYEAPWRSCSKHNGEARTKSYRKLTWTSPNGKKYRAKGTWDVRVLSRTEKVDGRPRVLAESNITIE